MKGLKKLLPIAVTLALVAALAVPMAALADVGAATVGAVSAVKGTADATYTIVFTVAATTATDDTITIVFPEDTVVAADTGEQGNIEGTVEAAEIIVNVGDAGTRTVVITIPATVSVNSPDTVTVVLTKGITNPTVAGTYTLTVTTNVGGEDAVVESANYNITETDTTVVLGEVPAVIEVTAPNGFTMPSLDPSASQPITSGAETVEVDANGAAAWTLWAHEAGGDGKMEATASNDLLASEIKLDVSGASENDVVMSGTAAAIDTHASGSATLSVTFAQNIIYADDVHDDYTITITFTVGYDA